MLLVICYCTALARSHKTYCIQKLYGILKSMSILLPRKRLLLLAGLVVVVVAGLGAYYLLYHKTVGTSQKSSSVSSTTKNADTKPSIRFAAMGDMLAHDTVNQQAKKSNTYDYKPFFSAIRPLYAGADVVFCNPETLVSGTRFGISGYPTFNAPSEFARDLASPEGAGCNVINLATNHIGDKGQAAIDATLDEWTSLKPLAFAGANRSYDEQYKVRYFTKNGITVAFLAFADYSNDTSVTDYGLNIYHRTELVDKLMKEARQNAEAVIVSMHWGTEDSNVVNADQVAATAQLAELGADVVIGTGPHVVQKATWVTGKDNHKTLVWYSIGNMLSAQLKPEELTSGVAGFTLVKSSAMDVSVMDVTFKPTFMSYDWSAADKASDNLLARHNLKLQPLTQASGRPEAMFGSSYSVSTQLDYVKNMLTTESGVKVSD